MNYRGKRCLYVADSLLDRMSEDSNKKRLKSSSFCFVLPLLNSVEVNKEDLYLSPVDVAKRRHVSTQTGRRIIKGLINAGYIIPTDCRYLYKLPPFMQVKKAPKVWEDEE